MRRYLACVGMILICSSCQRGSSPQADDTASGKDKPIQVVATVGMVADIVRQIGGDHVSIEQICGPGVDPHLYKATRDDVQTLNAADLIFYSGLMLEGKLADTLIKMARIRPVIAVTEMIPTEYLMEPVELSGHYDPHVWMDVSAWSRCIDVVAEALAEAAPDHKDQFKSNQEKLKQEYAKLHEYGKQAIASIPEKSRLLITSHDAFNYLGRAYGIDVEGIQGISTESEAGLQRVNQLVQTLVERKVQAVFIESSVPRKSIDALIEGAAARGLNVKIGGELFSDAMGNAGTYEGTYVGMIDHNLTIITRALGGDAPERGLNGQLEVRLGEQE